MVAPSRRKEMARCAIERFKVSIRVACEAFGISQSYATSRASNGTTKDPIYRQLELNLRIRLRKRLGTTDINQIWSMDFMHDQL